MPPAATPEPPKPDPTDPPAAGAAPGTYTVQSGDSLTSIATQLYGDANQWMAIYDANRDAIGDNPNRIRPGTQLTLPNKEN